MVFERPRDVKHYDNNKSLLKSLQHPLPLIPHKLKNIDILQKSF